MTLNLARQPFVNSRPVRRLTLVLWALGLVLSAVNLTFYWRYFSGQEARRDRLQVVEEQIGRERATLEELDGAMAAADLEWQNQQVGFLNQRIAARMFPWSRLFDQLAEVLPAEVRLTRLRPAIARDGEAGMRTVRLDLRGEARADESVLEFVQRLYEHPSFSDPNLSSESRRERSQVTEFNLVVRYLPDVDPAPPPASDEAAPAALEEGP